MTAHLEGRGDPSAQGNIGVEMDSGGGGGGGGGGITTEDESASATSASTSEWGEWGYGSCI